jgi:2-methylisocitrate lyase-like PEP mutase family enzyme
LARTDALACHGFDDAIRRLVAFRDVGCDMTFLEAPESVEQMRQYCLQVSGPKLANMIENGKTPILSPLELKQMGYTMVAYPITLLSASIKAMNRSLALIKDGLPTDDWIVTFPETKDYVGFTRYHKEEERYKVN